MTLPERPCSADRTRSPAAVFQKREYFKYLPETIGYFSLEVAKFGVRRPTVNFIAAGNRDVELAEAVATAALERLVSTLNTDRLLFTATVLVECAAGTENRSEALATLARRLENMAFVAPAAALPEALDIFRILQSVNEELNPLLARAVATARLGAPRIAAA
jgi:hypothetical protein